MFLNTIKAFAFLTLILLSSCFPFNEGICDANIECNSDEECVESHGENFVCYTRYYKVIEGVRKYEPEEYNGDSCVTQINSCIEDKCSNYDCGELGCTVLNIEGTPLRTTCNCGEGKYYNLYNKTCVNSCNLDSDCESGYKCNNINECSLSCNSDEDCKNDEFSNSQHCDTNINTCYVLREYRL